MKIDLDTYDTKDIIINNEIVLNIMSNDESEPVGDTIEEHNITGGE